MAYRAYHSDGRPAVPGDLIFDFKGDHATFCHVSRDPDPVLGTLGKVTVQRQHLRREYFARTFDLEIREG